MISASNYLPIIEFLAGFHLKKTCLFKFISVHVRNSARRCKFSDAFLNFLKTSTWMKKSMKQIPVDHWPLFFSVVPFSSAHLYFSSCIHRLWMIVGFCIQRLRGFLFLEQREEFISEGRKVGNTDVRRRERALRKEGVSKHEW